MMSSNDRIPLVSLNKSYAKKNKLADVPPYRDKNCFYTCSKYSEQWFAENVAEYHFSFFL